MSEIENELLKLTQELLNSIASGDWDTYTRICDPTLTAFEPESMGRLVHGMPFHRFYFDLPAPADPAAKQTTICDPHVRVIGDVAVVAYTRLVQAAAKNDPPTSSTCQETRVWQRVDGQWRHVHFHRS